MVVKGWSHRQEYILVKRKVVGEMKGKLAKLNRIE